VTSLLSDVTYAKRARRPKKAAPAPIWRADAAPVAAGAVAELVGALGLVASEVEVVMVWTGRVATPVPVDAGDVALPPGTG
jgi:hypothetical protein